MGAAFRPWPRMMKRATACAYLDISATELEREIAAGRLPHPVLLGKYEHWSQAEIDSFMDKLTGTTDDDWRMKMPLYAEEARGR